jgi:hypothetical protein
MSVTGLWRRLALRVTIGVGGAVAILLSLGLHLFDLHAKGEVATLPIGAPVEAGEWRVTLHGASIRTTTPDGRQLRNGQSAIIVATEMTNRTGSTSSDFYSLLRLDAPPSNPLSRPTLYLTRDKELLTQLQPGLAENVDVAWILPADQLPPASLTLSVMAKTFKPRDNLYAAPGWFNEHVVGTVNLPVERGDGNGTAGG